MKKILTYILAAMIFSAYASQAEAMAGNFSTAQGADESIIAHANISGSDTSLKPELIAAKDYKLPIIPKPSNLPGPDKDKLKKQAKGARNILSNEVMPKLAVAMIGFVGGVSLLMLIIGGVRFAMVYGTEENVEKAKKQVIYAIMGLVLALLSYTIVAIISNLEYKGNTGGGAAQLPKTTESAEPAEPASQPTKNYTPSTEKSTPGASYKTGK